MDWLSKWHPVDREEVRVWEDGLRLERRRRLLKQLTRRSCFEECVLLEKPMRHFDEEFDSMVVRGGLHFRSSRKQILSELGVEPGEDLGIFSLLPEKEAVLICIGLMFFLKGNPTRGFVTVEIAADGQYSYISSDHLINGRYQNIGWKCTDSEQRPGGWHAVERANILGEGLTTMVDKYLNAAASFLHSFPRDRGH